MKRLKEAMKKAWLRAWLRMKGVNSYGDWIRKVEALERLA